MKHAFNVELQIRLADGLICTEQRVLLLAENMEEAIKETRAVMDKNTAEGTFIIKRIEMLDQIPYLLRGAAL